jgi:bacteriophage N4 adsorption protein B
MLAALPVWLQPVDRAMLQILAPLALAILISGLDDLTIDLAWAADWLHRKLRPRADLFPPGARQVEAAPRRRIAILVPLWQEHRVIARMLEHAVSAIRYQDYHIFAGAYPNDDRTQEAIRGVAARFPHIHLALCPHDGPTSKADCLNWIFQHVIAEEQRCHVRFDVIVTHDAEDLIHPDELGWINLYSARYDFIQTPVLALPTPLLAWTHGIYCDEFAEYHTRDMVVRPMLGGFVPGAGVGTGYRRDALERLAEASSNRLFEPEALTEDYENGLKMFRLGCSQAFVPPLRTSDGSFLATREYFPQSFRAALRQRTRWVTGIALQGWQRHGWGSTRGELYWMWRDRKGLIANPLGLAANLVFVYGVVTAMWMRVPPLASRLVWATLALQIVRLAVRMMCVGRVYGIRFACGVPVRAAYANALNSAATVHAVARYLVARARRLPLRWFKTDHAFPSVAALVSHRRKLGEILVSERRLTAAELKTALETQPAGVRLGEHLARSGVVSEARVYESLSLQHGMPILRSKAEKISTRVARALPRRVAARWRVLPFRVGDGNLHVASPEVPSAEMTSALRAFTALEIRFHLIAPVEFETLAGALL